MKPIEIWVLNKSGGQEQIQLKTDEEGYEIVDGVLRMIRDGKPTLIVPLARVLSIEDPN